MVVFIFISGLRNIIRFIKKVQFRSFCSQLTFLAFKCLVSAHSEVPAYKFIFPSLIKYYRLLFDVLLVHVTVSNAVFLDL